MDNLRNVLMILAVLLVISTGQAAASNFVVGLFHIEAEVQESIFCVPACDGNTIEIRLWPGETDDFGVEVHNIANIPQTVRLNLDVSPEEGIQVEMSPGQHGEVFEIPANSMVFSEILLTADPGAAPRTYDIEVEVKRGGSLAD